MDVWYDAEIFKNGEWKRVAQTTDFDYAVWCLAYSAYDVFHKRVIPTPMSMDNLTSEKKT